MDHFDSVASPVRSGVSSFTDLGGAPERFADLITVDSLFSVVKESLPGLTRVKNSGYYYIRGKIKASDLQALYNHTQRICELTLGKESDSKSRLASNVFVQIAHRQDPNTPLFPYLNRLRIIETSPSLDFLHVLLSSTLKTLELRAIPDDDPHYPSVLSFLECAVDEAPNLSTLILGSGTINDQILDTALRYKNLRHLKFLDVGIAITDQWLRAIGSLQHLETLVLRDNGNSTYKRSPAIPAIGEQAISPGQQREQELEFMENVPASPSLGPPRYPRSCSPQLIATNELEVPDILSCDRSSSNAFPVMNEPEMDPFQHPDILDHARSPSPESTMVCPQAAFHFGQVTSTSPAPTFSYSMNAPATAWPQSGFFGQGRIPSSEPIASPVMSDRSMDLRRARSPSPEPTTPNAKNEPTDSEEVVDSSLFRALRSLDVGGSSSSSLIEDLIEKVSPSNLQELSIDFTKILERKSVAIATEAPSQVKKKKRSSLQALKPAQPPSPPQIAPMTLLRRSIQKWGHTLVSVSITNNHTTRFSLSSDVFESLVLRPDMKRLEITGIGIDSMDNTLCRLQEVADFKLEVLHLPIHVDAPSISPRRLRDIAEAYPRLTSFRSRLRDFSNMPLSFPLSHQLEVLTVSNDRDPDKLLLPEIARYLDSIFPRLKSVQRYDEDGNNAKQWRSISTLVTVCQAVRMDEQRRLSRKA